MADKLSASEVDVIQTALRTALSRLDACGQDDLADEIKEIYKKVAARSFDTKDES
jgi:uncharacterized protein (UPF0335 family)